MNRLSGFCFIFTEQLFCAAQHFFFNFTTDRGRSTKRHSCGDCNVIAIYFWEKSKFHVSTCHQSGAKQYKEKTERKNSVTVSNTLFQNFPVWFVGKPKKRGTEIMSRRFQNFPKRRKYPSHHPIDV